MIIVMITTRGAEAGRLWACQGQVRPQPHLFSRGCHTLVSGTMLFIVIRMVTMVVKLVMVAFDEKGG